MDMTKYEKIKALHEQWNSTLHGFQSAFSRLTVCLSSSRVCEQTIDQIGNWKGKVQLKFVEDLSSCGVFMLLCFTYPDAKNGGLFLVGLIYHFPLGRFSPHSNRIIEFLVLNFFMEENTTNCAINKHKKLSEKDSQK